MEEELSVKVILYLNSTYFGIPYYAVCVQRRAYFRISLAFVNFDEGGHGGGGGCDGDGGTYNRHGNVSIDQF
jgi:hypothetical protein